MGEHGRTWTRLAGWVKEVTSGAYREWMEANYGGR
uniref:Uncharacterized protein n=1 Tax=mine drainage metagenome TaxID=410659 RepID=E6QL56_9ZZZZ